MFCIAFYEVAAARDYNAPHEAAFLNTFNISAIAFTNKIKVFLYALVVCNYRQFSVSAAKLARDSLLM
jgi:hypothetical protein